MAVATITFTDNSDGTVKVKLDFENGINEDSNAHYQAAECLQSIFEDTDTEVLESKIEVS